MPVETATYVSQLVATNPAGNDDLGQGDDHHRLIKTVLQNSFLNMDEAVDVPALKALVGPGLPVGMIVDYAGASAPSRWLLCYGQAISRTTYADLFAILGTTYGTGDGSTTFNLPDLRGRVVAGQDDMGGVSADRLTNQTGGVDGDVLGAVGGAETHTITLAQMPAHDHGAVTGSNGAHSHFVVKDASGTAALTASNYLVDFADYGTNQDYTLAGGVTAADVGLTSAAAAHTHSVTSQGSGTAHNNVQPTIVLNKIIYAGV